LEFFLFLKNSFQIFLFQFYIFSTKHLYFWNKTLEMFLEYNFQ